MEFIKNGMLKRVLSGSGVEGTNAGDLWKVARCILIEKLSRAFGGDRKYSWRLVAVQLQISTLPRARQTNYGERWWSQN